MVLQSPDKTSIFDSFSARSPVVVPTSQDCSLCTVFGTTSYEITFWLKKEKRLQNVGGRVVSTAEQC